MNSEPELKSRSVLAALIAVQILFGTLPIIVKLALRDMSAPTLALLRVSGAAVLFLILQSVFIQERVESIADYLRLALYGALGVALNQLFYIISLTLTTATAAQTLVTAGPAITLMMAILLKKEQATTAKWLAVALAGSGALVLVGAGLGEGKALGNLLALLNVTSYSTYLVLARGLLRRYDPMTVTTWMFVFGMLGIVPVGIGSALHEVPGLEPGTWLIVLYIITFPSVGAYYLNSWALARVESSLVSTFVYLQPAITALVAYPVLGEHPSPRLIPGVVLIFAGVAVAIRAARPQVPHLPTVADQAVVEP